MIEIGGRNYQCVRGSDVDRDGMYLELSDPDSHVLAEIFYSDKTNSMTVTAYEQNIPLDVLEWFIAAAKTDLLPISESGAAQR